MLKQRLIVSGTAVLISLHAGWIHAQELMGAGKVIEQVLTSTNAPADTAEDESESFEAKLQQWEREKASLDASEAAEQWFGLMEAALEQQRDQREYYGGSQNSIIKMLAALPVVEHWDALAEKLENLPEREANPQKLREATFRFLAQTLRGNGAQRKKDLQSLQEILVARAGRDQDFLAAHLAGQVVDLQIHLAETAEESFAAWQQKLALARKNPDLFNAYGDALPMGIGEEKLRVLIREVLLLGENAVYALGHEEGLAALARQVALENLEHLDEPPWQLCSSVNATELYEALKKKFGENVEEPEPEDDRPNFGNPSLFSGMAQMDSPEKEAASHYIVGLVLQDRADEALELVKTERNFDLHALTYVIHEAARGRAAYKLYAFLSDALQAQPGIRLWESYIMGAARTGNQEKVLTAVEDRLKNPEIGEDEKRSLRRHLGAAQLAAGNAEQGVESLRQSLDGSEESYQALSPAARLLLLGELRGNQAWMEEGLAAMEAKLLNSNGEHFGEAEFLTEAYNKPEFQSRGERVITQALAAQVRATQNAEGPHGRYSALLQREGSLLYVLANIYFAAGRTEDVLTLLDEAPWWPGADLAEIRNYDFGQAGGIHGVKSRGVYPIRYIAAASLIHAGQKEKAIRILEAILRQNDGFDPAYRLYLETNPTEAVPFFESLFELNQFEERPLIWMAQWNLQQKELETAEDLIRKAIEIDPSDGEQGPGDRMRAYSVLADIREARGDKEQAEFFRKAVQAIRLSEQADRIYAAGLLSEGIETYERALTFFSDAYCIQSRLAVQLSEMGLQELAEKHYIKAFELMPDSFGRMESHCFGCEGVFESESAQNVAEKVFTRLLAEKPDKAQLHYLFGYLKETQGQYREAAEGYREAVRLDPDYINAWKKLASLGNRLFQTPAERDEVIVNLLRLDPLGRHGTDLDSAHDLRKIWPLLVKAEASLPNAPGQLLRLTAAAEAQQKKDEQPVYRNIFGASDSQESLTSGFVASHPVFRFTVSVLQTLGHQR